MRGSQPEHKNNTAAKLGFFYFENLRLLSATLWQHGLKVLFPVLLSQCKHNRMIGAL